tara:strand:- start:2574 stop:2981 length:408 start_codon:yes stop_codon:yes gene_type:complete
MKKCILLLLLIFSLTSFAQNKNLDYFKITQKECLPKKGYQLVLKQIVSDSRCPAGVNCIWAGEVKLLVSVYHDKQFIKDETVTVSGNSFQENKDWFVRYLPSTKKNVQTINVFPYPKEGIKIAPNEYYLKIGYLK